MLPVARIRITKTIPTHIADFNYSLTESSSFVAENFKVITLIYESNYGPLLRATLEQEICMNTGISKRKQQGMNATLRFNAIKLHIMRW